MMTIDSTLSAELKNPLTVKYPLEKDSLYTPKISKMHSASCFYSLPQPKPRSSLPLLHPFSAYFRPI